MDNLVFEALIKVGLHAEFMQGRKGYGTGIRPNHWIPSKSYTFIGQIDFIGQDWLNPGESCEANGRFLLPVLDEHLFVPGFSWHICEGNKIMGYATILAVKAN